jgi:hypothetical protein
VYANRFRLTPNLPKIVGTLTTIAFTIFIGFAIGIYSAASKGI